MAARALAHDDLHVTRNHGDMLKHVMRRPVKEFDIAYYAFLTDPTNMKEETRLSKAKDKHLYQEWMRHKSRTILSQ